MGALAFVIALWGIPGAFQLIVASVVGLATGIVCFILFSMGGRLLNNDSELSYRVSNLPTSNLVSKSKNVNQFSDEPSKDHLSLSVYSPSNYEGSPHDETLRPRIPKKWNSVLIHALEWRVFDRLCVSYWRAKGNSIVAVSERSSDGIDFIIGAPGRKELRLGVIQTRSANASVPTVEDLRILLELKRKNKLAIAVLMYSGRLSNVATAYCAAQNIRLIDPIHIAKGLNALPNKDQQHLLKSLIRPDYNVPTCPSCRIKLVKRQHKTTDRIFWGCISYPLCQFKLDHSV